MEIIVLKPSEFDMKNMGMSEIKKSRIRTVKLYHNNEKIYLHVPKSNIPFGISGFKDSPKKHLDFSISNQEFQDKLFELEKFIIDKAEENCNEWFGQEFTRSELESNFIKPLRKNGNYLPLFKQKLIKNSNDIYKFDLYDENKNKINLEEQDLEDIINKGDLIASVAYLDCIWIMNCNFGLSISCYQMMKIKKENTNVLTTFQI